MLKTIALIFVFISPIFYINFIELNIDLISFYYSSIQFFKEENIPKRFKTKLNFMVVF